MGWDTDLLDARFRGVPFQVLSLMDKGEKSLVVHEYPYRSGGEVEDMGCGARVIPIRAVFWGEGYAYDVQNFVEALEAPGAGELIHPIFGSIRVTIKTWTIEHTAERPDYAEVFFEAVVTVLDEGFLGYRTQQSRVEHSAGVATSAAQALLDVSTQCFTEHMQELSSSPVLQAQTAQNLSYLLDFYDPLGNVPRSMTLFVHHPRTFVIELLAVQRAIVDSVLVMSVMEGFMYWSGQFPKLDPVIGMKCFENKVYYPSAAGSWSTQWTTNGSPGKHSLVPSLPLVQRVEEGHDSTIGSVDAIYRTEQSVSEARIITHTMLSQTYVCITKASQLLFEEGLRQKPSLTPLEIEAIIGNIRSRIQDCLVAVRQTVDKENIHGLSEPLRTAAEAIQTLGSTVLHLRPPLIRYRVAYEESLHLLAHRLYGAYDRAREILHLNPQIYNPNFLPVGQELLIYAAGRKDV